MGQTQEPKYEKNYVKIYKNCHTYNKTLKGL